MRESWDALAARVGFEDDGLYDDLVRRYSEPHRRYHTADHLFAVVGEVERRGGGDAALLAAWFHDAVYDPRSASNEERSAQLAEFELGRRGVDPRLVARVAELVRATAGHDEADGPDAEVLFAADLAILSAPWEQYEAYARAIRLEYEFVPDDQYKAGRARILRSLLDTGRLDDAARANIERELGLLSAPGHD